MALDLAFSIIGSIVIGTFIGYQIDKLFQTTPVFLIIGLLLGVISAFLYLFKMARSSDDQ